ncbi:hypothetical protein P280DRAFT_480901 [Massarina eburnea CBS 473.64]|uniref:Uncharacterized protein n=1 Tax=Massarina eburnea CBS 473.64 TaxID=1395130 RepID=A0A6A6RWB6_9PLEO|nr:hypothetical protein P280DRAFT_480901 [Massarina eburnea CBS 473.64]
MTPIMIIAAAFPIVLLVFVIGGAAGYCINRRKADEERRRLNFSRHQNSASITARTGIWPLSRQKQDHDQEDIELGQITRSAEKGELGGGEEEHELVGVRLAEPPKAKVGIHRVT